MQRTPVEFRLVPQRSRLAAPGADALANCRSSVTTTKQQLLAVLLCPVPILLSVLAYFLPKCAFLSAQVSLSLFPLLRDENSMGSLSLPPWISHRADKRVLISSTMRFTPFLAMLPALAAAQEQAPLGDRVQGWFNKAKSYLPTATPVIPVAKVVEQKVQEKAVTPFNLTNWQSNLAPSTKPQDLLLFVTGGNKTCFGQCGQANKAFNVSVVRKIGGL